MILGIENAPYVPDVDIRDWIKLDDVMKEYGVGPNGAQIIAADLLALNIDEMKEIIESLESDYVIFDTPGPDGTICASPVAENTSLTALAPNSRSSVFSMTP